MGITVSGGERETGKRKEKRNEPLRGAEQEPRVALGQKRKSARTYALYRRTVGLWMASVALDCAVAGSVSQCGGISRYLRERWGSVTMAVQGRRVPG